MDYKRRIADKLLDLKLNTFGATLIIGPKGCGKTTTAKQKSKSWIEFQDEDNREKYLSVANAMPSKLLIGKSLDYLMSGKMHQKFWGGGLFENR